MDEGTKTWCMASGLTGNALKALIQEEIVWMQTMRAMTTEVVASHSLGSLSNHDDDGNKNPSNLHI